MEVRTTVPDSKNKYYLKQPAGWSKCILGNPDNRLYPNSVLCNCVGYAVSRFNELCRENNDKWLGNRNPGGFIPLAKEQGLKTGDAIKPGCCVVLLKHDKNNGHVLIVEKVSGGSYYISESGWGYKKGHFLTNRWTSKAKNFGMSTEYKFAGCIYNPGVDPYEIPPADFNTYHTKKSKYVKFIQWALIKEKCYANNSEAEIDGSAGAKTKEAIKAYQKKHGLKIDGWAGPDTISVMKKDYAIM